MSFLTYPLEAFRLAEGPSVDRIPDRVGVHRSAGIPGLVAALVAVDVRRCVAAVEEPEVIWG